MLIIVKQELIGKYLYPSIKYERRRGEKGGGGQVPFFGLPVARIVASSPNLLIIFTAHASPPYGFPLTKQKKRVPDPLFPD